MIRKIQQLPLPHFQISLPTEKATTESESILNALYPQGYFTSNAVDVLSAVELEKKKSSSIDTRHIAFGLLTSWHETSVASNLDCLSISKHMG